MAGPEAVRTCARRLMQRAQSATRGGGGLVATRAAEPVAPSERNWSKNSALKIYPVVEETQTIGGICVTVYLPKTIPPKNRNKVALEVEMDAEAIAVANLGQVKSNKKKYLGGGASIPGNE